MISDRNCHFSENSHPGSKKPENKAKVQTPPHWQSHYPKKPKEIILQPHPVVKFEKMPSQETKNPEKNRGVRTDLSPSPRSMEFMRNFLKCKIGGLYDYSGWRPSNLLTSPLNNSFQILPVLYYCHHRHGSATLRTQKRVYFVDLL